ncbi:MAG: repressor LexA [Verrucomicrobia bacterium]|nr:repressor LexA [Verrucomicrobiota bacterium]
MTPALTPRQQQVLNFIQRTLDGAGQSPSLREIAQHFGFRSMKAAADHVTALRRKGVLEHRPRRARSLRVVSPLRALRRLVVDVPVYGAIPAGRPDVREQRAEGCISADIESLGIRPTARTFALRVRGDSMIGKHIADGDYVILEHGKAPRNGDVVAALIDSESTLKTFVLDGRRAFLKAENPRYPQLIPAEELVVQGVMVALIRKAEG